MSSNAPDWVPGPRLLSDGSIRFSLWSPRAPEAQLSLPDRGVVLPMEAGEHGVLSATTDAVRVGGRYAFRVGERDYPDPASRFQPGGVHDASAVVDFASLRWSDVDFVPPSVSDLVIYELHVGTFTEAGTFAAAAERLPALASLGVTAVEVMPIAEFPGVRNWGYDGVALYAASSAYGGPYEFARFVDAAHAAGIGVLLDVVFNHFGPEGNYSGVFGPYTSGRYRTPWGEAINFDGAGSDRVREFYLGCVDHWMRDCHVDGFRLDAVHEIHDESAVPFLSELSDYVRSFSAETGKTHVLIAESDLNDRRITLPRSAGGRGMHAAWSDDFHHAVHALLTGERNGYYADFGAPEQVARAIESGWCYSWQYSLARDRRHGNAPEGLPPSAFVFCTQNHDQVGNRMLGERLRAIAGVDADRLSRALLLLSPCVPLLFMGQEYGEERPFLYFVDHTDAGLLQATREGRTREFAAFHAHGSPPDPGAADTRDASVLRYPDGDDEELSLTRTLLALRREYDCFRPLGEERAHPASGRTASGPMRRARNDGAVVVVRSEAVAWRGTLVANLSSEPSTVSLTAAERFERQVFAERLAGSDAAPGADAMELHGYGIVAGVSPAGAVQSHH